MTVCPHYRRVDTVSTVQRKHWISHHYLYLHEVMSTESVEQ